MSLTASEAVAAVAASPRNDSSRRYRGRFAPSPTGPLHFGSLVAALTSYCDARAAGGQWLLRIEDVDRPRARPGAEAAILTALEGYGFAWDGPILRQSERSAIYESALAQLADEDLIYPCVCSRRELETAPCSSAGERIYPGTCRHRIPAQLVARRQRAWRVKLDPHRDAAPIVYQDRLQGLQSQSLIPEVGDFVLKRADGMFAYQLAVVVDDAAQGITDVVRGADLCASTPRQIFLQQRLRYRSPRYLHLPVVVDAAGQKLSKQSLAAPLAKEPLPALVAAWRLLRQALPESVWKPATVDEFWMWATQEWSVAELPAVPTLPEPDRAQLEHRV